MGEQLFRINNRWVGRDEARKLRGLDTIGQIENSVEKEMPNPAEVTEPLTEISDLIEKYQEKFNRKPVGKYAKDIEWLKGKLNPTK